MSDQIEELIREIAVKHGIAVGRDDPILILQTINARLMADSAEQQQRLLDAFKEELEAMTTRWDQDSRDRAERVLNAALTASKKVMASTLEGGASAASKAVEEAVNGVMSRIDRRVADSKRIAVMNMIAGLMAIIAAGLAVWATT